MKVDVLIAVAQHGGVENVINMTASYLQKRDYEVRIVQIVFEGYYWIKDEIPFYPLLEGRNGHDLEEFAQAYAKFIQKNGVPEIVLATAWPYMCYVAKKAAYLSNTSLLVISWLHAPVARYQEAGYGGYESLTLADAHFVISNGIFDDIRNHCKDSIIFSVRNPIDFSKCMSDSGKANKIRDEKKKLFYVGRLSEEKCIEVLIKALGQVKEPWELHIVGDGEDAYKESLMRIAKDCLGARIGNLRWYGWKENPWKYAVGADAVVLASVYEGFPLVAIEAEANGVPVISTPVNGIVDVIKPGVNGFLYPFHDAGALAEILDAISVGILPQVNPKDCQKSVIGYRMEYALADFEVKLREFACNRAQLIKKKFYDGPLYCGDKISVIIPCFNVERYIRACIESLFKQSFPLDQLEFLFIDDASTDATCQILKEYEAKYAENILLIECEHNIGPGAARNIGLQYATGKYIVFVDADDIIREDMIQLLYEKIVLYQCDMCECGYDMFTDDGYGREFKNEEAYYLLSKKEERKQYIVKHGHLNSAWAKIYRKEFLEKYHICFPENIFMEDMYFHQMSMMYADSCYVLPDMLYHYRYNPDSIMHRKERDAYFMDQFYVQEKVYQDLLERGKTKDYINEIAFIYYVKGFIAPVRPLISENGNVEDEEKVQIIREKILDHFPDILENPYIIQDTSEYNQRFLELLL